MITESLKILSEFCKGCGTCEAVCPAKAITLRYHVDSGRYFPSRQTNLCTGCKNCYHSCPAWPSNPEGLPYKPNVSIPPQKLLGSFIQAHTGHAVDPKIRTASSSGGITPAILVHALEKNQIDTALVVRLRNGHPLDEPELLLARNCEEILSSVGSKYRPVPLNKALRDIINRQDIRRVGIAGLPCHIEGLKKAQAICPILKEKIAFTIGLFCRHTKELAFTRLMLARLGLDDSQTDTITYRGSGWPGLIIAKKKDGTEERCGYFDRGLFFFWLGHSFSPLACFLCSDPTAECADLSCGDAWLSEFANEKQGASILISRNSKSENMLKKAVKHNIIALQPLEAEKIIYAQLKRSLLRKKINYHSKLIALHLPGYKQIDQLFKQPLDKRGLVALKSIKALRNLTSNYNFIRFYLALPSSFFQTLKIYHRYCF